MSNTPVFKSTFSEKRWVTQINKTVSKQIAIDIVPPPTCVFRVPKAILDTKPEAYIPPQIGLGPYHHFRAEMQKMLRYKLAAVKKVLTDDQIHNFQSLVVDKLKDIEPSIRACYDEYLDLDDDTLAWILALDGLFLLYRLGYGLTRSPKFNPGDKSQDKAANEIQILDDQAQSSDATSGTETQHPRTGETIGDDTEESRMITEEIEALESPISWKSIVKIPDDVVIHPRDILMLENQIPLLVLKEIQNALHLSSHDSSLDEMLAAFAEEHSPLQLLPSVKFHQDASPAHLLDFMYHLVVSNIKPKQKVKPEEFQKGQEEPLKAKFEGFKTFLSNLKNVISMAFSDESLPKPLLLIKNLFFLGADTQYDTLFGNIGKDGKSTVEEIVIPPVSELARVGGVTFNLTPGGIRDIRYDEKELIFYLPMITLKINSEIIIRNLIAYEQAVTPPGSILELTEYVELMCGIVDTAKDAELLREKGIIKGDLSNDGVANLFNGIPRYNYLPNEVSNMRITYYKVKKRFNSRPIVKAYKFLEKQAIIWWKVIATVVTILVVLLVIFQQVCAVYGCSSHMFNKNLQQPSIERLYGPM